VTARSSRREVRNPVLALPAARALQALPPEVREHLAQLLGELAADAQGRATVAWQTHKAPMAAYWKACAVYSGHLRRVLRATPPELSPSRPENGLRARPSRSPFPPSSR